MTDPTPKTDPLSDEAAALCNWLRGFDWDFERAAEARNISPRLLYRQWLESLGWNQSLAARLYRRKGSNEPVSRQAIEGQMKRFGVIRPPNMERELAGQDLEGGLDALRDLHLFIKGKSSAERLCCEQLLELAETYKSLDLNVEARSTLLAAADLAERTKSPELMARAVCALTYNLGQVNAVGQRDSAMVAKLEGWLPQLRELGDDAAVAYCLAYLGYERHASGKAEDWESFRSLTKEAMEIAFRSGSPRAVNDVCSIRIFALSGAAHLDERIRIIEEMEARLPNADTDRQYWTLYMMLSELLEAARIKEAYSRLPRLRELENVVSVPWVSRYRASLAVLHGHWAEAEQLAEMAGPTPTPSSVQVRGLQQAEVLRHRGEWRELATLARWNVNQTPRNILAQIRLAGVLCLLGEQEKVRAEFETWASTRFEAIPHDFVRIDNLCSLSEICHALEDRENAAVLYELLDPYRDRVNLIRVTAIVRGAIARFLGLLCETMGDWDQGIRDFEFALKINEELEARPYLACTQYELARMLFSAGREQTRARDLADLSARSATSLGMLWLAERAENLLA